MAKNNNVKVVSPVGVSQYAWLTTPDTRFDETGHYKTNLIINAKEAQSLKAQIDAEIKKSVALAKEKAKGKAIKEAPRPYDDEMIDGKASGNVIFKFKTKAKIIAKDGKVIPNRVALFDSAGKPMIDANVWSGSEMKVSAELIPYYTAMAGAGVSMRLRAVQVTKLVEGGSSNAKGYGFEKVKDGYEQPEAVAVEENVSQETSADF
jgi:hypothetical protein|tara:strand:- start:2899 stop:3516 length:618 start_codon:yes stop_codon:yes gene_type:complete